MAPRGVVFALACAITSARAAFTNSFDGLTHGRRVEVSWDKLSAGDQPAYLSGRIFNETENGVVSFQANLSIGITDTTFSWINAPYPLPYMPTAQYELELLPENPPAASDGASNGQTSLAKSDLFYIIHSSSEEDGGSRNPTVITEPHPTTEPTKSRGGPSTAIIIVAVCVGLGVPILAGIGVWIWCMRRERRRRQYEESRRIRYQTIID